MENTKFSYSMTLDFETTIFVSRFDKTFEEVLSHLDGCPTKIGQYHRFSHKVDITDSPVMPDNDYTEKLREIIFEQAKVVFENRNDINATVEKTEFAGIRNFKTRKI